jgi:hypothetical protein
MKTTAPVIRGRKDVVTEELVAALSGKTELEFKPLFTIIHAKLIARGAAGGSEEMLRLTTYERLQNLVRRGVVNKTGKSYAGVASGLAKHAQQLVAFDAGVLLRKNARAAMSTHPAAKE